MKVAVSFLSSNYSLEETISILDKSACDYIHVDIMDGVFVNNKTYDEDIFRVLRNVNKPLDIHLMVEHPISYIERFKELNPSIITIHKEINDDINKQILRLKEIIDEKGC